MQIGCNTRPASDCEHIVTDLLKALRNSGHAVPQQDDATVLWKNSFVSAHARVT
jgi:hypothetical protein